MDQLKTGRFIKELRKEKNFTQEQLAEKLNVSRRTVSRWETGSNMPDIDVLVLLADLLGVDIRELIEGERKERHSEKTQEKLLLQLAEYERQKERLLARKIYVMITCCLLAWIISLVLLSCFSTVEYGVQTVLISEVIAVLIYSICMCCVKTNRTATGYISTLVGAFGATILSNLILLILFFGSGDYHNYGIVGVYYVLIIFAITFVLSMAITGAINRREEKI